MRLRRSAPLVSLSVCVLLGCTDKDSTDDATTMADGDDGDTDGEGEGTAEGSDDGTADALPARGDIALTTVVVNQGVDVPIAVDGVWVGPEDRNTYVVGNRDTLIRAYWTIPAGWTPRPIRAQLELEYPDGSIVILNDEKTIDGEAFAGDLDRGFYWSLIGPEFDPGVKFYITLWEAEDGHEDIPESTTIIGSPVGGLQQIGIQPEPMQMKVEFFPVRYTGGACDTDTSTLTAEEVQNYADYLHEMNPVQEVIFNFRTDSTIQWTEQLNSLSELWGPLWDYRDSDNADPNTYYYAVVDVCGNGIDGAAGIAPGTPPPTKNAAMERVSAGVWLGGQDYAYHTFVHELGHNQGRPHVYCAGGGAAGTTPDYPYDNGIISVWGFGIRFFKLYSPTGNYDYMTYCAPNWVSDWTWSKVYTQIRELTSWDFEGGEADDEPIGQVLIGLLLENGSERWSIVAGGREPEFFLGGHSIGFDYGDGEIEVPAAMRELDDGTRMIMAPVPHPGEAIADLRRITSDGESEPIDIADVHSTIHAAD